MRNTCDPFTWIEASGDGWVRYVAADGRRWEVHGECDRRGYCWQGAVGPAPALDCPVGPGFTGCCPLAIVELAHADPAIFPRFGE